MQTSLSTEGPSFSFYKEDSPPATDQHAHVLLLIHRPEIDVYYMDIRTGFKVMLLQLHTAHLIKYLQSVSTIHSCQQLLIVHRHVNLFQFLHARENIQHFYFCNWSILIKFTFPSAIHFPTTNRISLTQNNTSLHAHTTSLLSGTQTDYILTIMSSAVINMNIQVYHWCAHLTLFDYILKNEIDGS